MTEQNESIPQTAFPISIDYCGRPINKLDLMLYLNTMIRIQEQIDKMTADNRERRIRADGLLATTERRKFYLPTKEKPTGLSALSRKKKQEYQEWLSKANEREAELRRKEQEEDNRIASIHKEIEQLNKESFATINAMYELADMFEVECKKQIIAPDYRDKETLKKLLGYLYNGRANTLAEALNLFHEDKHREEIIGIMDEQTRIARAQYVSQQKAAEQQLRAQMAILEEQQLMRAQAERTQQSLDSAVSTLKDIRFYEQMLYLQNL